MIFVVAIIEVNEGQRAAFLEEFHRVVPKVRAEDGCIEYGPTVDCSTDISMQQPLRADVVTILEKWESLAALKAHLAATHMQDYRQRVRDFVKGAQLHILEPA